MMENEHAAPQLVAVQMPEPTVTFTVKEVLQEIRTDLREIKGQFFERLEVVEKEVAAMRHERENRKVFRDNWLALLALAAAVAAGLGTLAAAFHV